MKLQPAINHENYQLVSRRLVCKMLREFHYENLIQFDPIDSSSYELKLPSVCYSFSADLRILGDYVIDPASLQRREIHPQDNNQHQPSPLLSPMQLMIDLAPVLKVKDFTLAYFLKELQHTLLADLHLYELSQQHLAKDLIQQTYEQLEGHFPGHPWLVVSKGRFGFGYDDYLHFAPESLQTTTLHWLAIHPDLGKTFDTPSLQTYQALVKKQLGEKILLQFQSQLQQELKESPFSKIHSYFFIPVHSWQWKNFIIFHYLEEIALKKIIYLGENPEEKYLPQQAIRTFSPTINKKNYFLKLTMNIFNTAVYRGIPYERVKIAPPLSQWLQKINHQDSFLHQELQLVLLGEVSGAYVEPTHYQQIKKPPYQFKEMLACIWREPLTNYLQEGEEAILLAGLLHRDGKNDSLVEAYIKASSLTPESWLEKLHQVILQPLLHYLYQYGVAFNAHGQNLVIVLKNNIPLRLVIKDFSDDVNICSLPFEELEDFPVECRGVTLEQEPEILKHFIFSSLFICLYRYLSDIFLEEQLLSQQKFWSLARQVVLSYQKKFPHLQERFIQFDLLAPQMPKVCLNRVRLLTYGYNDDSGRPEVAVEGMVDNPLCLGLEKDDIL